MKVEIDFPASFESGKAGVIPIGRFYVGNHVIRLAFFPNGKLQMAVPQSAIDKGDVVVVPEYNENTVGFGLAP